MTTTAHPAAIPAAARTGRLLVHAAARADVLVDALGAVLAADPPADPFQPEVVAVPTRGVERWVAQRLSHRLGALDAGSGEAGVCANVAFDSPARVVHRVVAAASGIDPDDDPWQPERLAWHVLRAVDAAVAAGEAWAEPLARYLTDPPDAPGARDEVRAGRRMRLAQRLAALFSAYGSQRPSLAASWASGDDDDGAGLALPGDLAWQPPLWRAVRDAVGTPSPAERLASATAALRDDPALADLPARVSVFGPTRLPEAHLDVLGALAAHRDVHLWLPYPSRALWARATERAHGLAAAGGAPRRREVAAVAQHPFLGSLARDATELSLRLAARDAVVVHHDAPAPAPTVLGALQAALRADARPRPADRLRAAPGDRSVQVHACHGRSRQVEVLRETILGLLADDPTLEPRDVVVLCPDVEAFAPLVTATFGAVESERSASSGPAPHPGRTLRVRVADRSPARTNPLLRVVAALLELAGSRVTASGVVDLAGLDAVRRRFRLDDDDLERLRAWTLESGVRWGEDAGRRSRFGVGVGQGTWSTAMDRLLLGVAVAEGDYRHLDATLPLDDVGSTDADLAGRFAELVDRLTGLLAELAGARPATAWFDTLDRALTLLADVAPTDQWQRVEARAVLADARASAGVPVSRGDAGSAPLRLPDVVALLAPRLAGRPTRAGFRTGALTVCSLEPMRTVPHRVVCLLGMDDTAFPRAGRPGGDDVLAREPLVGERDARSEDRQLFLDAVLAAADHLVVVHSGADERTGRALPPAVPVGELLDAIDECVDLGPAAGGAAGAGPGRARDTLVTHHPLQTVDERNFVAGALGRPGPFSFDDVARRAAVAGRSTRHARGPLLDAPLAPPVDDGTVLLDGTDGLVPAMEHPVKAFVRGRLAVSVPRDTEDLVDRLPLELGPLDGWAAGDRLLTAVLDGVDLDVAARAERLRGRMPPARLGLAALQGVTQNVEAVAAAARPFVAAPPTALDVTAGLPDSRVLVGTVPGVRGGAVGGGGATLVRATYSRLAAKHRLRAWVQLLALVAGGADVRAAVTVGRGQGRRPSAAVHHLVAPPRERALELLARLVALRDRALREPLPLAVELAETYARRRTQDGATPDQALRDAERTLGDRPSVADEYQALAWGDGWRLAGIAGVPSEDERLLAPDEPTRFGALARAVWDPLLAHERTGA